MCPVCCVVKLKLKALAGRQTVTSRTSTKTCGNKYRIIRAQNKKQKTKKQRTKKTKKKKTF